MDQLVKEESQKLLAKQMQQARIQRQIQVRQQALAWSDVKRKKFEKAKEETIKKLATQVTVQAQNTAIQNIQHLNQLNDLAMAEIGMAHRAAAGIQNVERLKSLKRLKNEEVAKNRGASAMMKLCKEKKELVAKRSEILNRKKSVREMEDRKSQDIINNARKPLALTNVDTRSSKPVIGPPEYQQGLAKTLSTADSTSEPDRISTKKSSTQKLRATLSSSTSVLKAKDKKDEDEDNPKFDAGIFTKMVRVRVDGPPDEEDKQKALGLIGTLVKRKDNMKVVNEDEIRNALSNTAVRYFDTKLPKGEVKYLQPYKLAVKETRTDSPDAWEKGRQLSEQLLEEKEERSQKRLEIERRQRERSERALLEERLSKEKMQIENQIKDIVNPENKPLDVGDQRGIFEIGESKVLTEDRAKEKGEHDLSSEEFLAVETDEEFVFPGIDAPGTQQPQKTIQRFSIGSGNIDPEGKRRRESETVRVASSSSDSSVRSSKSTDSDEQLDTYGSYRTQSKQKNKSKSKRKSVEITEGTKSRVNREKSSFDQKLVPDKHSQHVQTIGSSTTPSSVNPESVYNSSPPDEEGPYHSTPDDKLQESRSRTRELSSIDSQESDKKEIVRKTKSELLQNLVSGVISKKPESIDKIQLDVSSNASRVIVDSDYFDEVTSSSGNTSRRLDQTPNTETSHDSASNRGSKDSEKYRNHYYLGALLGKSKEKRSSNGKQVEEIKHQLQKEDENGTIGNTPISSFDKNGDSPPAEGPYHSTPDGKLHKSRSKSKHKKKASSLENVSGSKERRVISDEAKDKFLKDMVQGLMSKKPESMAKLPLDVSSNASRLVVDSDFFGETSSSTPNKSVQEHSSTLQSSNGSTDSGGAKSRSIGKKSSLKHAHVPDRHLQSLQTKASSTSIPSSVNRESAPNSPPDAEGPYHSTPDGKLHESRHKTSSSDKLSKPKGKKVISDKAKEEFLKSMFQGLISKKPESIAKLPLDVSSNASRLVVDSDVFSETSSSTPSKPVPEHTSTPQSSNGSTDSGSHRKSSSMDENKRRALAHYVSKFLDRKPESIEQLPVTVSSSSIVQVDSEFASSNASSTSVNQ